MSKSRNNNRRSSNNDRGNFAEQLGAATNRPTPETPAKPHMSSQNRSSRPIFNFKFIGGLTACSQWRGDGIDHVNIGKAPATELGQALSTGFMLRFKHDVFGEFASLSRLWDAIDNLVGTKSVNRPESEIFFILADAMWQKVQWYPELGESILKETRPFDMYTFNDFQIPSRSALSFWWLEAIYAIRDALRKGAEYPDFSSLIQGNLTKREDIMQNFIEKYIPNRPVASAKKAADPAAPSLIRTLRESPPVVLGKGLQRFSLSLKGAQPNKRGETAPVVTLDESAHIASPAAAADHDPVCLAPKAEAVAASVEAAGDQDEVAAATTAAPVASLELPAEPLLDVAENAAETHVDVSALATSTQQMADQASAVAEPDHANDESFSLPGNMPEADSTVVEVAVVAETEAAQEQTDNSNDSFELPQLVEEVLSSAMVVFAETPVEQLQSAIDNTIERLAEASNADAELVKVMAQMESVGFHLVDAEGKEHSMVLSYDGEKLVVTHEFAGQGEQQADVEVPEPETETAPAVEAGLNVETTDTENSVSTVA